MKPPLVSHQRADKISFGLFLVGLGILTLFNNLWPEILLLVGAVLAARQYLRGRRYDIFLTLFVFGGLYAAFSLKLDMLPVVLTLAGIFLIFREYFVHKDRVGIEETEDMKTEIEDAERK